jgi:Protein of unknown function (DUF3363)
LHRATPNERIVGRVVAKGLGSDELGERIGLTIDGVDGHIHHLEVPATNVEDIARGSIISIEPPPSIPRTADRNILAAADANGIYSPAAHREQALSWVGGEDADAYVRSYVRRLEALRRAGIVERVHAEHWTIPADLPERGLAYDRQRFGNGPRIDELSHLPLDRQVRHEGATWLDRTMLAKAETMPHGGFGSDVRAAWGVRKQALADMGYVRDLGGGQFRAPTDLIAQLERAEIERAGKSLAAERGLEWQPAVSGNYVSGQLVGSTQLSSDRFAMIDDGLGFSLVPWRPALEQHIGRHISGIAMPGGDVDWSFGRKLGLGL